MPGSLHTQFLDKAGNPLHLNTNLTNVNLQSSLQQVLLVEGVRFLGSDGQPVTLNTKLSKIPEFNKS